MTCAVDNGKRGKHEFTFDSVFRPDSQQSEIFGKAAKSPVSPVKGPVITLDSPQSPKYSKKALYYHQTLVPQMRPKYSKRALNTEKEPYANTRRCRGRVAPRAVGR